ncbi:MAG: hypothetical protein IPQ08_00450 [Chitinophagaceae bacterium]|nr:hypothetical protein [Chitinophagaceae bacterium]
MNSNTAEGKFILYPRASLYFALGVLITWIGFSQSYFSQLGKATIWHHLHGASAGAWMVVLISQPWFYKTGRMATHKLIGKIAVFTLVPVLVVGGWLMMHSMMVNVDLYPPDVPYTLSFIDAFSIIMFIFFIYMSLAHSKFIHRHARYMSLTILVLMPPALTRLLFLTPWFHDFPSSLNMSFAIVELVLLLLILDDKRSGKIHLPYVLGIFLFALLHITMNFAAHWDWWRNIMDQYGAFPIGS